MILEIKILLVFERTFKILQHLMLRILFRKISVFRRNAPINAKRFIQDRDTPISLRVIEVITLILKYSSFVSIRSTPYCISQKNVVTLHGGIIFLILRQEYEV